MRKRLSIIFKNVMFSIKLFKSDLYVLINTRFNISFFRNVITRLNFFFFQFFYKIYKARFFMFKSQYKRINNDFVKFNKNLRFETSEMSIYETIIFD